MKTKLKEESKGFKPFEIVLTFESIEDVAAYQKELTNCHLGLTDDLYMLLESKLKEV